MSKQIIDTLGDLERRVKKERHILIVDNEPLDRQVLREQLTSLGCSCQEAMDCSDAFQKFEGARFDVCMLDLRMPGRDGVTCARALKKIYPATRMVICTGYPNDIGSEELKSAGVLTLLSKPTTTEDLQRMLREFNL